MFADEDRDTEDEVKENNTADDLIAILKGD